MSETNGQIEDPTRRNLIEVRWNPETKAVAIGFSMQDFGNFDFVAAVLEMAKGVAEDNAKKMKAVAFQQEMQAQAIAAQEAAHVKRLLGR